LHSINFDIVRVLLLTLFAFVANCGKHGRKRKHADVAGIAAFYILLIFFCQIKNYLKIVSLFFFLSNPLSEEECP